MRISRTTKLFLGFGFTALFVYLIAEKLDWELVGESISRANWEWLILGLVSILVSAYFRIVRWWRILLVQAPTLTLKACVWPYLLGVWLNIAIPFRAGDFARAFGFREQLMSPASRILGLLVLERVLDLVAVFMVFLVGTLALTGSEVIPRAFTIMAVIFAVLAVAGLLGLILLNKPIRKLVRWLSDLQSVRRYEFSRQLRVWMDHFFDGISTIRQPRVFLSVILLTAIMWTLEGFTYYTVALAVGAAEPPLAPWFAFSTATLATAIPSTPGFVGTFDYFAALGMSAFGVDWNTGTVFAVVAHIILVLPFALIVFAYGGFKYLISSRAHDVREQAEKTKL